jgi:hypothetical protein
LKVIAEAETKIFSLFCIETRCCQPAKIKGNKGSLGAVIRVPLRPEAKPGQALPGV